MLGDVSAAQNGQTTVDLAATSDAITACRENCCIQSGGLLGENRADRACDVDNQDLKYAFYDGASWQITTVDAEGDVGQSASIALDSAGRPHVSYYDLSRQTLKYAVYTGVVWQLETVGQVVEVRGREGTSIALDSENAV
jgi:hypothetical protein